MSLALLDRAQQRLPDADERVDGSHGDAPGREAAQLHADLRLRARGGCTLDQLITARWQELVRGESASCPVCDGRMVSDHGRGMDPRGRCLDCGTTLA